MSKKPAFYDPTRIGTLFYPDMQQIADDAKTAALPPAAQDAQTVHLVLIDMQVDFCHESGSLYVPGALQDIERLNAFIFRHAARISQITCTLDSHLPYQIFHAAWWSDADGNPPPPLTVISDEDVSAGKWRPLLMADHSRSYVHQLEEQSRKQLMIWPYHTLIGSSGHMLDPTLYEVVMWHALARNVQPTWLPKGSVPQTEHYSAIKPEIPVEDDPSQGRHEAFLQTLAQADTILIAGEAESHCVLETLADIVDAFRSDPAKLSQIYLLKDCTSPVQHPAIDFHAMAWERFEEFAKQGVNFVDSTDEAALPFG